MIATPPQQLYTAEDLFGGFNPWDKMGYTLSRDFAIYREFVANGGPVPRLPTIRLAQAEHDAALTDALCAFLRTVERPLVGVMGGHSLQRDQSAYAAIAHLARDLARENFLLVTGGGPGVMEAAHLGVAFSLFDTPSPLDEAIGIIGAVPNTPALDELFNDDWTIREEKLVAIEHARDWFKIALEVRAKAPEILPVSLAIPTWLYGAEPTMPFATHYAKYFQNSLREEALISNSRAGIIYGRGGGGTLREIFQDVERNFYAKTLDDVTPIVFFDRDDYWRTTPVIGSTGASLPGVNLQPVIRDILSLGLTSDRHPKDKVDACLDAKLLFTTDYREILAALRGHQSTSQRNLHYGLAAEPLKISSLRMNRR